MAVEEPKFRVLRNDGAIQVRAYDPVIVAETEVEGDFGSASTEGFRRLAGYIFGGNQRRTKIDMTAPVGQARNEKIAMTAPVGQARQGAGTWLVMFTMPAEYRIDTLPTPNDDRIVLREVPSRQVAVLTFSGKGSQPQFIARQRQLERWLAEQGLQPAGEAIFARFNPPWVPWFLRRNEVQLPVHAP